MKQKWWVILILLVPLALIAWWVSTFFASPKKEKIENPFYKVKKGALPITVIEKGILEPKEVMQINTRDVMPEELKKNQNPPIQQFTIMRLVPQGEKVKKGDFLVEFNRTQVDERLKQAEIDLKSACDTYEQALTDLKTKKQTSELEVERKRIELKRAQETYNDLLADVECCKISVEDLGFKEARLALKSKKIEVENSERELQVVTVILKKYENIFSEEVITKTKSASKQPDAPIILSDDNVLIKSQGGRNRPMGSGMAPRKMEDNIPITEIPDELKSERRETLNKHLKPILDAIKNIQVKNNQLDGIKEYPNPLIIFAPCPGHVFYGSAPGSHGGWGGDIKVGASMYFQQPLFYISNTVDMKVELSIDEISINKVKKGLFVKVTPDAFPDLILSGVITSVSEVPARREYWEQQETKGQYPVTVWLNDSDPKLRPKMSTKCAIMCEEIKDVLIVPLEAIFEKEGKKVCYVLQQGNPVERIVKTGKSNDDFIIIEDGLKEGEEVYLYDPFLKK